MGLKTLLQEARGRFFVFNLGGERGGPLQKSTLAAESL